MRKFNSNKTWFLLTLMVGVVLASCLKDKGYEDGEYGAINSNVEGGEWVSIPRGASSPVTLGLESKAGNQTVETFVVSYDYKEPASQDVTATIAVNNALVTALNDPSLTILPANTYTIPSANAVVKAGQRVSDPFALSMNTSLLDPTKKYAIGFTMTSVSKGSIPSNLKNVVYIFTVKNRFDGVYQLKFRMDPGPIRLAAGSGTWIGPYTYAYEQSLITTGPNSVVLYNSAYGLGYHPLMTPGASGFGSTEPLFTFDANNKLVSVVNNWPNPSNGRSFRLNPAVTDSRWDPATKTVYAAIIMDQPGFDPLPIYDTFKFLRAR
jgi:hypothetical protein